MFTVDICASGEATNPPYPGRVACALRAQRHWHRLALAMILFGFFADHAEADNPPCRDRLDCRIRCDSNDLKSCTALGRRLWTPFRTADWARAAKVLDKACDGGQAPACATLGQILISKEAVPKDPARATVLFKKACDAGDLLGCGELGATYVFGRTPPDPSAGVRLLERACTGGHGRACAGLVDYYKQKPGGADPVKALAALETPCKRGKAEACHWLAMVCNNVGACRDAKQRVAIYDRACELGSADACLSLSLDRSSVKYTDEELDLQWCRLGGGHACVDAARREKSPAKKRDLLERGCRADDRMACMNLADELLGPKEEGRRVGKVSKQDAARALGYQEIACELDASYTGDCDDFGKSLVEQGEVARGVAVLEKRCDSGVDCETLADLYLDGRDVPRDLAKADRYYRAECTLRKDEGDACGMGPKVARFGAASARCLEGKIDGCETWAGVYIDDLANIAWDAEPSPWSRLEAACATGRGTACTFAGWRFYAKDDQRAALPFFKKGCEGGDPHGCTKTAETSTSLGNPDPVQQLALLTKACDLKDEGACALLGEALVEGSWGIASDPAKGLAILEQSCARGAHDACEAAKPHRAAERPAADSLRSSTPRGAPPPALPAKPAGLPPAADSLRSSTGSTTVAPRHGPISYGQGAMLALLTSRTTDTPIDPGAPTRMHGTASGLTLRYQVGRRPFGRGGFGLIGAVESGLGYNSVDGEYTGHLWFLVRLEFGLEAGVRMANDVELSLRGSFIAHVNALREVGSADDLWALKAIARYQRTTVALGARSPFQAVPALGGGDNTHVMAGVQFRLSRNRYAGIEYVRFAGEEGNSRFASHEVRVLSSIWSD